ncbi:MAG: ATP-dependent helicase [Planctomycetes bacterium]|jgi:non-specific serine/threonine protein kinase|nr:ATP-dependent helicase [Planctomycetota bacterium]
MAEVYITPGGHLRWQAEAGDAAALRPAAEAFGRDWREGLFVLAAEKLNVGAATTVAYWRRLAERYLSCLCHIPSAQESFDVAPPSEAERAEMLLSAPPMRGGEYLSGGVLEELWSGLVAWGAEAIAQAGGLSAFLHERAPHWRQVGRVCFHLAENKADPDRPFAFLATFSTGFGAGGKLKHLPLRNALQQYAGAKNRPALVKLLEPIQAAAKQCEWIAAMTADQSIFAPATWTSEQAYRLLRDVPAMEDAGLMVRLPNWWQKRPRPQVSVTIKSKDGSKLGANALLDFDVSVALGDESLSAEEIEALLDGPDGLVSIRGQWVEVDREKLSEALNHWRQVERQAGTDGIGFIEGMRLLAGTAADLSPDEQAEDRQWAHVAAGPALREALEALRQPGLLDAVEPGGALKATLRPYQREGLAWLNLLTGMGLGACLADDMGLGKTIQVLALLLCRKHGQAEGGGQSDRPALLVVPASLLGNWREEASRFAPSLELRLLHPSEMPREEIDTLAESPQQLDGVDLVVTTYAMLTRLDWLTQRDWSLAILDEAQAIKNPGTRQTRAVKKLAATSRITLTGTPIENRLGDLWSLMDFLNPGLLGSAATFKQFVKQLDARERNRYRPLRQLVRPYILRRLKTDKSIIADLPEKTETNCYCGLSRAQARLYEAAVQKLQQTLENSDGMARRGAVLSAMMQFKQICNHPSQFTGDGAYAAADSGKFRRLGELCEELASRQEKLLVFTQFREIIDAMAEFLAGVFGRDGLVLHGGTSVGKRKKLVASFQDEAGPPFFILSLKAGGTGLNLTAASHVVHFDRWWNPAVENQATDRAFRIGQQRNVQVHKFVTTGTVEERIDEMLAAKQELADDILTGGKELNVTEMSDEDILSLVRLDVNRASV